MEAQKFGPVAIFLHWLVAVAIIFAAVIGLVSDYTNDTALTRSTLAIHQSVGFLIFVVALARLAWRIGHPAPPLPADMPRSHKVAAHVTHAALYLLMFALPVTGYIGLAARGREIGIFGLFNLPNVLPLSRKLSAASQNLHDNGQYVLYALLLLHVGAALYHRIVLKDGILERMLPDWRRKPERLLQSADSA